MNEPQEKAPKRVKDRKQTPEERMEALRYNQMMYGRTDSELKHVPKRVDYGASFLKHPKFQSLVTAFRKGAAFKFDVTAGETAFSIATDGAHITVNDRALFYSRPLNKHMDNLFLDRAASVQLQGNEVVVHLVFAVLKSFPELGEPPLLYLYHKFYHGSESLESGPIGPGTNLLVGPYRHSKPQERAR